MQQTDRDSSSQQLLPQQLLSPVKNRDVERVRAQVRSWLENAERRATAKGKPLLVMIGEHHGSALSTLLTIVIYQEAHKLGIHDTTFEKPRKNPLFRADLDMPISRLKFMGHPVLYHLSSYHGKTQHMIDGRHLEGVNDRQHYALDRRDETMAANLSRINRPTFALVGADHLPGLERYMSRYSTHEVISFDVSQDAQKRTSIDHVIKLDRDASKYNDDTLLRMGLGKQEGDAFIAWAESQGRKLSNATRDQRLQHPVSNNNRDPIAIERQLDAFYDAGRFPEAAKAIEQLRDACNDLHKPSMPSMMACATGVMAVNYRYGDVGDKLFPTPKSSSLGGTASELKSAPEPVVVKPAQPKQGIPKRQDSGAWYTDIGEAITNLADDVYQNLPDFLKSKPRSQEHRR